MSPDITQQLRSQMEQVQVQLPRDLVRQAYRGHRRRQFTARAVAAGAAAIVIGAGTAFAAGPTRPAPAIPAQTTAYVVSQVTTALGDRTLIEHTDTHSTLGSGTAVQADDSVQWVYRDSWRMESVTPAGKPILDQGTTFTRDGATVITVDYAHRTWDRLVENVTQEKFREQQPSVCEESGLFGRFFEPSVVVDFKSEIQQGLRCGMYKLDGRQRVRGVDAIRLIADVYNVARPPRVLQFTQTLWIDPVTFLPLQTRLDSLGHLTIAQGKDRGTPVTYVTVTFTWLRPVTANLRGLTPPIPAGFRHVNG